MYFVRIEGYTDVRPASGMTWIMNQYGFSIIEVMVSLVLMTGTSLALMKHHWLTSQWLNQLQLKAHALIELDNASERIVSGNDLVVLYDKRFFIHQTHQAQTRRLSLQWQCPSKAKLMCDLTRELPSTL